MPKGGPIKGGTPLRLRRNVSRIVQSLTGAFFAEADAAAEEPADLAFVADEVVTRVIAEWRARASYLPRELLADPAWGILLELLEAEVQCRRASLSSVRKASAAPASTADRWLRVLERRALVVRRPDPLHPDEEILSLSRKGSSALRRYFHEVVQPGGRRNGRRDPIA